MARLRRVAKEEGLPWTEREMTYNSRKAQELGKWAESKGRGPEFHRKVFEAYFGQGLNIGDNTVLASLAAAVGLVAEEAREVLEKRVFQKAVDADWERSRRMGVYAVPTLFFDGRFLVGAQPYARMAAFLEEAGVKRREERTG